MKHCDELRGNLLVYIDEELSGPPHLTRGKENRNACEREWLQLFKTEGKEKGGVGLCGVDAVITGF